MKKIILHVGFHKTATSSIQSTLFENRGNLSGFTYPVFKRGNKLVINHSIPIYSLYCGLPDLYHMNKDSSDGFSVEEVNERYLSQLHYFLENNERLIFSGEDISMLSESQLLKIKDLFSSKGFDVKVYCSVRRPYSFLCSELQERVKSGFYSLDKIKVHKKIDDVEKLKRVFHDDVVFFSFEEDKKDDGVVLNFIKRIGLDSSLIKVVNKNEGLSNFQVRLFDFINGFDSRLRNKISKDVLSIRKGEKFNLNSIEFSKVKEALSEENEKAGLVLGGGFCDVEYSISDQFYLSSTQAHSIYMELVRVGVPSRKAINYIFSAADFEISEFALLANNAEVFREVALIYKEFDLEKAYRMMVKAKELRPNGPFINEKIKEYEKELAMCNPGSSI